MLESVKCRINIINGKKYYNLTPIAYTMVNKIKKLKINSETNDKN